MEPALELGWALDLWEFGEIKKELVPPTEDVRVLPTQGGHLHVY